MRQWGQRDAWGNARTGVVTRGRSQRYLVVRARLDLVLRAVSRVCVMTPPTNCQRARVANGHRHQVYFKCVDW